MLHIPEQKRFHKQSRSIFPNRQFYAYSLSVWKTVLLKYRTRCQLTFFRPHGIQYKLEVSLDICKDGLYIKQGPEKKQYGLRYWPDVVLPGGRLNKKDGLTRCGDSHVKDKTS